VAENYNDEYYEDRDEYHTSIHRTQVYKNIGEDHMQRSTLDADFQRVIQPIQYPMHWEIKHNEGCIMMDDEDTSERDFPIKNKTRWRTTPSWYHSLYRPIMVLLSILVSNTLSMARNECTTAYTPALMGTCPTLGMMILVLGARSLKSVKV
jgi:hypothetical protein